jgi:hypothetical protein
MTDSPAVPAALGVESVQWLAEGGESLTVRITVRWRGRPPTWTAQPLLVVEAHGRRHRFPALPEPSSFGGAATGTWRITFPVPTSLAPHIGSRAWLQLGAVIVPLPVEIQRRSAAAAPLPATAPSPPASVEPVPTQPTARARGGAGRERVLRAERELASRAGAPIAPTVAHRAQPNGDGQLLEVEARMRALAHSQRAALRDAQARVATLERELYEQVSRAGRAYEALEHVRAELAAVREAHENPAVLHNPPLERATATTESATAQPDAPSGPAAAPPDTPAGPVDAARLEAALTRLRDAVPDQQAPAGPTTRWLEPVFKRLAERDPAAAGRLVIALLPAQPLVYPLPVTYDLVLSELGCVSVTSASGEARVEFREEPRPGEHTQLVVTGELAGLGRLLARRRARRRARGGGARAKGDKKALRALRALVRAPVRFEQLYAAGFRPEPPLALLLVSLMIRREWAQGEDFIIAHYDGDATEPGAALRVCDKPPVAAGAATDLRPGATRIRCAPDSLLPVLVGAPRSDAVIEGDLRPLRVLQDWLVRAQSG